ncbi:MAG TPA: Uma2 family endonuclease [Candidatus Lokiarchaeia archaeon]|nr:Uma2 family endonuclease [Candidatus Lokiarchaeia archaeon]
MVMLLKFPKELLIEGEYILLKPDVSEEEFWEISDEDSNFELIDGVLVIHSPASEDHEDILGYLQTILRVFLEETGQGKIYGSRFVMRLNAKWNPEPDLMIIRPENYENIKETLYEGAVDVAIEILSKSTKDIDLTQKIPKYLEAGVKEVWIFDPHAKTITIQSKKRKQIFQDPDVDDCIPSDIIENIPIKIKWIWHRDIYPSNAIVKQLLSSGTDFEGPQ